MCVCILFDDDLTRRTAISLPDDGARGPCVYRRNVKLSNGIRDGDGLNGDGRESSVRDVRTYTQDLVLLVLYIVEPTQRCGYFLLSPFFSFSSFFPPLFVLIEIESLKSG